MPKSLFVLIFLIVTVQWKAQNSWTWINDSYSGINSATVSPTQPFLSPNPWDINITGVDSFLENDYAYISQQSLLGLSDSEIVMSNRRRNISGESEANVFDFFNRKNASFLFNTDILGPSFSMTANIREKKYIFGLFTRARAIGNVLKFDNYFRYGNEMVFQPADYRMKPFSGAAMSWNEIGLNASTQIFPNAEQQWIIGANLKYAIGLDAANIVSHRPIELTATDPAATQNPDLMNIYASDFDVTAQYITNYNSKSRRYDVQQNGSGLGMDLGITVLDKNPREDEYNYKLSFSILDVGMINFRNGINHRFASQNKLWLQNNPNLENQELESPEQYLQLLSKEIYGNANQSFTGNGFRIGLPTSINFNFSQRIREHQFLNVNWVQRMPMMENAVKRNNLLNVNYLVQKQALGYGFSTSLSEYRRLNFGAYLRLGPLILGSENIFPVLFRQKNLHAAAFYMALKLYPFWDNDMKRHRRKKCDCEK